MNNIILQGTIVHKFNAKKVTMITVRIGKNYPTICFAGENIKKTEAFNEGDSVLINAYASAIVQKKTKKRKQNLYGTEIEKAVATQSEFNENVTKIKNQNIVNFEGEILKIITTGKNYISIMVRCTSGIYSNIVFASCYTNNIDDWIEEFKIGSRINASGYIKTSKKVKEEKPVYFETINVEKINKV